MAEHLPIAPILIPLSAAFLLPLVDWLSHSLRPFFCALAGLLTLAALVALVEPVMSQGTVVYWMGGWTPRDGLAIGVSLSLDGWGLLISLIVATVALAALVYSVVYMGPETGKGSYYVLVMLLEAALIGFCLSGDLFNQFVWLEVFSVAGFALTAFHYDRPEAVEAAFKYLVTNSIAALFIVIALTILYMQTGALNIAQAGRDFHYTTAGRVAIGLLIGGYATKAALAPWHFWLPDAHAVAPAPISAIFSGALIKVGVYAIGRSLITLAPIPAGSAEQAALLVISALTIVVGGVQMLQQESVKRILAFSSVAQMGYAVAGLAIGTPLALAGAAMHLISHALVKSALFMAAGMLDRQAGIHLLVDGGGLVRRMPATFGLMLLAGLGLAGAPLFSAFAGKTMLEEAAGESGFGWLAAVAVFGSLLTVAGLARLLWRLFAGRPNPEPPLEPREAPLLALLPIALMVAGSLFVGLFPAVAGRGLAWPAAAALVGREDYIGQVMAGEPAGGEAGELWAEEGRQHTPAPLDLAHWPPALIALAGGLFLAYLLLVQGDFLERYRASAIPYLLAQRVSRWHSGLISDYALWNAFGTAAVLTVAAVLDRLLGVR
jgi:multicomponent Na+:H+ antiporter subunit D